MSFRIRRMLSFWIKWVHNRKLVVWPFSNDLWTGHLFSPFFSPCRNDCSCWHCDHPLLSQTSWFSLSERNPSLDSARWASFSMHGLDVSFPDLCAGCAGPSCSSDFPRAPHLLTADTHTHIPYAFLSSRNPTASLVSPLGSPRAPRTSSCQSLTESPILVPWGTRITSWGLHECELLKQRYYRLGAL